MLVRDVDRSSVEQAVTRLRDEPEWARGSRRLRDEILELPHPEHGAELLVRLGREREPIVAPRRRARTRRVHASTAVIVPTFGNASLTHTLLRDVAKAPWTEPVVG